MSVGDQTGDYVRLALVFASSRGSPSVFTCATLPREKLIMNSRNIHKSDLSEFIITHQPKKPVKINGEV
jgi:hypothetical protein